MKTLRTINRYVLVLIFSLAFLACESDEEREPYVEKPDGPPVLSAVHFARDNTPVTEGMRGNMYIIFGSRLATTQAVYFNGREAYFNPTLVRDDNIILTIPEDTPWKDASNTLKVETLGGSAEMDFSIAQPAPKIDSFTSVFAEDKETVVITGSVFDNLIAVRFNDTEATVLSASENEITVEVPEGITQANIFVETPGGIVQAEGSYGFLYIFYDDEIKALNDGWEHWGWGGTDDPANTEQVKSGNYAFKRTFQGNWGGVQFGNGNLDLSGLEVLKISIFGGDNVGQLNIVINGLWDYGYSITPEPGIWNNYNIPLSDLGTGTEEVLSEIVIQEACGCGEDGIEIWIDDFGFN